MSIINVNNVLPSSGTTVNINGARFLTSAQYIAISEAPVALGLESVALGNGALTGTSWNSYLNIGPEGPEPREDAEGTLPKTWSLW